MAKRLGWDEWSKMVGEGIIIPVYDATPDDCRIYDDVKFCGRGIKIYPNVTISGEITIGPECTLWHNIQIEGIGYIGLGSIIKHDIKDPQIGQYCTIEGQVIESVVSEGCRIGKNAEVKRSTLGFGVKMMHWSGARDAHIGYLTNFSEGASIANFDGVEKKKTKIGRKVMIGVHVRIMGGVKIGDESFIADGARVDRDISDFTYFNPGKALKYPQYSAHQSNSAWYLYGNYLALEKAIGPEDRKYFADRLQKQFEYRNEKIADWLKTPLERMGRRRPVDCMRKDGYEAVYYLLEEYPDEILGHKIVTKRGIDRKNKKLLIENIEKHTDNPHLWLNTNLSTGVWCNSTPLEVLEMEGECMIPLLIKWAKEKTSI